MHPLENEIQKAIDILVSISHKMNKASVVDLLNDHVNLGIQIWQNDRNIYNCPCKYFWCTYESLYIHYPGYDIFILFENIVNIEIGQTHINIYVKKENK